MDSFNLARKAKFFLMESREGVSDAHAHNNFFERFVAIAKSQSPYKKVLVLWQQILRSMIVEC